MQETGNVIQKNGSSQNLPLGNNTKSSTPPLDQGRVNRAERYEYQSVARMLIGAEGFKDGLKYPLEWHRIGKCKHVRLSDDVGVHKSLEHGKAFYSGLMTCGSVWACPVCATKIQERRRVEIAQAIKWAYENDMKCVMTSLTFPHYIFDKLGDLLDKQSLALNKFRAGNPSKKFFQSIGYKGLIRSLEVTYGENGWHNHTHELWFVDRDADAGYIKKRALELWESSCRRAGLIGDETPKGFLEHAVDVLDNASEGDYLAKQDDARHWGADREMTAQQTKKGKKKGVHPFAFLRQYKEGDEKAGRLYIEFIETMTKRRKRQLYWSPGLKDRVGLNDVDDETIAEREDDKADQLGMLTPNEWSLICKNEAKAKVLNLAEDGGINAVRAYLASISCDPKQLNHLDRETSSCSNKHVSSTLSTRIAYISMLPPDQRDLIEEIDI